MAKQQIRDFADELEGWIASKGVDPVKARRLAFQFATKIHREIRPVAPARAKISIEDTFKQNGQILIILSHEVSKAPRTILDSFLERQKDYPKSEMWRIEKKSGGPAFMGTPYLCTVLKRDKPEKKSRQTKQEKKPFDPLDALAQLSKEEKAELLRKLQK